MNKGEIAIAFASSRGASLRVSERRHWGHWSTPHLDDLLQQAQETFDPAARDTILVQAHALVVDEAPWVWIVHDLIQA